MTVLRYVVRRYYSGLGFLRNTMSQTPQQHLKRAVGGLRQTMSTNGLAPVLAGKRTCSCPEVTFDVLLPKALSIFLSRPLFASSRRGSPRRLICFLRLSLSVSCLARIYLIFLYSILFFGRVTPPLLTRQSTPPLHINTGLVIIFFSLNHSHTWLQTKMPVPARLWRIALPSQVP